MNLTGIYATKCGKCGKQMAVAMREGEIIDMGHVPPANGYGAYMKGCRAATFVYETGWDEAIPKSWTATPEIPK